MASPLRPRYFERQVERRTTSCKGIPRASIFDMTTTMVALESRRLRRCRSLLIVSGGNPCSMAGTARCQ